MHETYRVRHHIQLRYPQEDTRGETKRQLEERCLASQVPAQSEWQQCAHHGEQHDGARVRHFQAHQLAMAGTPVRRGRHRWRSELHQVDGTARNVDFGITEGAGRCWRADARSFEASRVGNLTESEGK
eukprot:scaffold3464_cov406-Prasinococcus_capsulatus_cf.AAC.8